MKFITFHFIFYFSIATFSKSAASMFNSLDNCKSWPAKTTSEFLVQIEKNGELFEFIEVNKVVILRNKKSKAPYAIFFDTAKLCKKSRIKQP